MLTIKYNSTYHLLHASVTILQRGPARAPVRPRASLHPSIVGV